MTYETLLAEAPPHGSPHFIQYLREKNRVVFEDEDWLVIENFKYHTQAKPWFTAFLKNRLTDSHEQRFAVELQSLALRYGHLEWKKKATKNQTVKRFHIHMYQAD